MKPLKEALFSRKNIKLIPLYTIEKDNIDFSVYINDINNILFELKKQ